MLKYFLVSCFRSFLEFFSETLWRPSSRRGSCHVQSKWFHLLMASEFNIRIVPASTKRLYRNIGMEELVPWIWSGTNHHDISSLCPPKDSRSGTETKPSCCFPDQSCKTVIEQANTADIGTFVVFLTNSCLDTHSFSLSLSRALLQLSLYDFCWQVLCQNHVQVPRQFWMNFSKFAKILLITGWRYRLCCEIAANIVCGWNPYPTTFSLMFICSSGTAH